MPRGCRRCVIKTDETQHLTQQLYSEPVRYRCYYPEDVCIEFNKTYILQDNSLFSIAEDLTYYFWDMQHNDVSTPRLLYGLRYYFKMQFDLIIHGINQVSIVDYGEECEMFATLDPNYRTAEDEQHEREEFEWHTQQFIDMVAKENMKEYNKFIFALDFDEEYAIKGLEDLECLW